MNKQMTIKQACLLVGSLILLCCGICFYGLQKPVSNLELKDCRTSDLAVQRYVECLTKKDYASLYEDSLLIQSNYNEEDAYCLKLKEIFEDVDLSKLSYLEKMYYGTLRYELIYEDEKICSLSIQEVDHGKWVCATVFNDGTDYVIESPIGVNPTVNGMVVDERFIKEKEVIASNFIGVHKDEEAPIVNQYVIENAFEEPRIGVVGDLMHAYGSIKSVTSNTYYVGEIVNDEAYTKMFEMYTKRLSGMPSREVSKVDVIEYIVEGSELQDRLKTVQTDWFTDYDESYYDSLEVGTIISQSPNTAIANTTFDYYTGSDEVSRMWSGGYQLTLMKEEGIMKMASLGVNSELNPNR